MLPGTQTIEPLVRELDAKGHYHTERAGTIRVGRDAVTFQLGNSFASFPYSRIDSVSGGVGILFGTLTLVVGGRREHFNWIDEPRDRVPAMIQAIRDRIEAS